MPKTLTQHQIRQRAAQALFSYKVQHDLNENVVDEFRKNAEKIKTVLQLPARFDIDFQDERIIVRKFPKKISRPLEALSENYSSLGIENFDKTALAKSLAFMRDFGSYAKKLNEFEANDLFKGIFSNLNFLFLFGLDLGEETPPAPKVLEFLKSLPKDANAEQALETFQKVFSVLHENVLEKYTAETFVKLTLEAELDQLLAQIDANQAVQDADLLEESKKFALDYDNEVPDEVEKPLYFETLVDGILNHQQVLETRLSEYLAQKWSFNRLTLIEQTILLIGAYEILFTETPDIVALNEAIELAKDFSDVKSSRFVNGVLTNLVKK